MDTEHLQKRIRKLLDEIQAEADPEELNRYRSVFRREVSFFRRSYLAAYLLMLAENGELSAEGGRQTDRNSRRNRKEAAPGPERRTNRAGVESSARGSSPEKTKDRSGEGRSEIRLTEEESTRLFINIGRNRKVFPREILGLINAKAGVVREDVGGIRILDNYSFIQVRNTLADTVIEALNGQNFRGKTLTVSLARAKKDENAPEEEVFGLQDDEENSEG